MRIIIIICKIVFTYIDNIERKNVRDILILCCYKSYCYYDAHGLLTF